MKHLLVPALVSLSVLTTPASAEEKEGSNDNNNGSSLMERGAELFWEGLRKEMAPSLEELEELMATIGPSMQNFLSEMGPALAEIVDKVEDWSVYEVPEILPNGDIIIRKKQPEPEDPKSSDLDGDNGATDL
ncbi:hypothetical protein PH5382_01175 [Phaeobacter sp. CECT 5382]|uniref:hypothetical protein n=1 Tax=Rhodobacterales TaxID=204455 RepID=UPI0006D99BCC|nr:hypothetical protein [Phaeobacter sp. CECT 5382]CUH87250.1 hypothetical protein PH5382_01175 [Phaeobacter sp. CECT 5382]